MRQTNAHLRHYYTVANALYFGNTLPSDLPIKFSNLRGIVLGKTLVLGGKKAVGIVISERLRSFQTFTVMTVLHEMLHVEKPQCKGHGWDFTKRMRKLANLGAFDGLW